MCELRNCSRVGLKIDGICCIIIEAHPFSQFSGVMKESKRFQVYKLNE